jgi:hypothetical protein
MTPRFRPSLALLESRENPASAYLASGAIAGGAPLVEVTDPSGAVLTRFQAFESTFAGGVRADTGELDGDPNTVEVAVVAGPGGGPRVQVYAVRKDTGAAALIGDFFAFEDTFRDGLRVAVGDVDGAGGGLDQIIVGADAGGGPRVRTFRFDGGVPTQLDGPLGNFFAYEPEFRGGVRVASGEMDGNLADGDELAVAAGPGGGPRVRVYQGTGTVIRDYFVAEPASTSGGANVFYDSSSNTLRTDLLPSDPSQRDARLNLPIQQALAAAAAQAAQQLALQGIFLAPDGSGGFTMTQTGPTSSFDGTTGAFGSTQFSNLGSFGTTQTGNLGAFGTGAAGTGVNGTLGTTGLTSTTFGTTGLTTTGTLGTGAFGTGTTLGGTSTTAGFGTTGGNTMTF